MAATDISVQAQYEAAFHHFKPDKRLRWLQEMGKVSVRLELEDRVVAVDVTPLQAAVVELFEGQDRWSEEQLMAKLTIDELALRGALAVWAGHGVLKEEDGAWRLLEVEEAGDGNRCKSKNSQPLTLAYVVESTAPAFESVDEERAAKGRLYWNVSNCTNTADGSTSGGCSRRSARRTPTRCTARSGASRTTTSRSTSSPRSCTSRSVRGRSRSRATGAGCCCRADYEGEERPLYYAYSLSLSLDLWRESRP